MLKIFKSPATYAYIAFISVQTAIYITFLVMHLTSGNDPVALKYSGILLCFIFALYTCLTRKPDCYFTAAAMLFTAVSDLLIFVLDDYYEWGLVTFITAQCLYFARIYFALGKKPFVSLAIRAAVCLALIVVLVSLNSLVALTALAAVYFTFLVANTVESLRLFKFSRKYAVFFAGLVLFIGCDICVGLNNFSELGIELSAAALNFIAIAMWAFYFPSQVLITLSANGGANEK